MSIVWKTGNVYNLSGMDLGDGERGISGDSVEPLNQNNKT